MPDSLQLNDLRLPDNYDVLIHDATTADPELLITNGGNVMVQCNLTDLCDNIASYVHFAEHSSDMIDGPTLRYFFRGLAAGLGFASRGIPIVREVMISTMEAAETAITQPKTPASELTVDAVAARIKSFGQMGLAQLEIARNYLGDHAQEICNDSEYRAHVENGFGYAILMVLMSYRRVENQMAHQVVQRVDALNFDGKELITVEDLPVKARLN